MLKQIYWFIIILLLLGNCRPNDENDEFIKNDTVAITTDTLSKFNNSHKKINKKTPDTIIHQNVFDLLKSVDTAYLPVLVKNYLDNDSLIHVSIDNDSLLTLVSTDSLAYQTISIFSIYNYKLPILIFSGYSVQNDTIINFFFELEKYGKVWKHNSLNFFANDLLKYLSKLSNNSLKYSRINNNTFAYHFKCNYPLIFKFDNGIDIFSFINNKWKKLAKIDYKYHMFSLNKIYVHNCPRLLTEKELEHQPVYYNTDLALLHKDSVRILDLSDSYLTEFPQDVLKLKYLQILILDGNNISNLPDNIDSLKYLQVLKLSNNQLTTLPESIGNLSNLQELYLNNNKIQILPKSLSKLYNLNVLDISNNQLSSFIDNCENLKKLSNLTLSNNKLETLPECFGSLQNLCSLELQNNRLKRLPESFFLLKHLSYLDIRKNKLPEKQILRIMDTYPDLSIMVD